MLLVVAYKEIEKAFEGSLDPSKEREKEIERVYR